VDDLKMSLFDIECIAGFVYLRGPASGFRSAIAVSSRGASDAWIDVGRLKFEHAPLVSLTAMDVDD